MRIKILKPFLWLGAFVLLVGLACNLTSAAVPATSPAPEQPTAAVPTNAPAPTTAPEPTPTVSLAISTLQDAKKAVIQIEAQGTFVDPEFGLQLNAAGRGSGFIIDPSGLAVTNNHVVTGAALLRVWVGGETNPRNARVVAVSECSDLALIDIEGDGYPFLEWYNGTIDVGLDMYVAGFPLGDPEYTLSRGVVSKARANGDSNWASVDSVLEYDANSNPGNSGGPVITADGKVIAVHYAGNSSTRQAFGVARDTAKSVVEELKKGQDYLSIGVNGTAIADPESGLYGIWVASVKSGSVADKSGIKAGDIIYSLEGLILSTDGTMKDYCTILRSHQPSDTLTMEVIRFSTYEFLEGQLNGRALEVTGFFGDTGSGGTAGGSTGGSAGGGTGGTTGGTDRGPYFTEEFDDGAPGWTYFLMSGDDNLWDLYTEEGYLGFYLYGTDIWAYLTYDEYYYADVWIGAGVDNYGSEDNTFSLVCRYGDLGWYEFSVANDGTYWIYAYDEATQSYNELTSGFTDAMLPGNNSNEFIASCLGNEFTLYINGTVVDTAIDNTYGFYEGLVGFSVSSFDTPDVQMDVNWFAIEEP